jgi:hypothetical protein
MERDMSKQEDKEKPNELSATNRLVTCVGGTLNITSS